MQSSMLYRCAFSLGAAAALLVGCGGSQPPIAAQDVMSENPTGTGYSLLYSFGKRYSGGLEPNAGLVLVNGMLYGTTFAGGGTACVGGCGVVFEITPSGKERTLYRFEGGNDGANPSAGLLWAKGLLYGTTEYGGIPEYGGCNAGTVFSLSRSGAENVVYRFYGYYCHEHVYNDGGNPEAALIDFGGNLYGTTSSGGSEEYYGTAFEVSRSGEEKVLQSFGFGAGSNPVAHLTEVGGALYGTTEEGGSYTDSSGTCCGVAFSLSTSGIQKVLYDFSEGDPDGEFPVTGLTDVKGVLYGTTAYGGADSGGTAFSMTTTGSLTLLHTFGSGTDGNSPRGDLIDVKGTLYGTTSGGGIYGKGTIFSISPSGNETVLYSFGYGSDGATPLAGMVDIKGTLYGTTSAGGLYGNGTVFALALYPHHGQRGE